MRRIIAVCLIILILALCSHAFATIQLGGDSGRAILQNIAANRTSNQTVQESNSTNDLWSWGSIPVGHLLNSSGMLTETPKDDALVELSPQQI